MKKRIAGLVIGSMFVFGSSSVALAGERTGQGNTTPVQAHVAASLCAFSGLEDGAGEPEDVVPGVVQNWGQIVSGFEITGPAAGGPGHLTEGPEGEPVSCNPTLLGEE